MKKILVTGLCTLHWGRLQYGNIGNYYIVEPLFRLLHKYYKGYEIITTFQMDESFIKREQISVVPMDLYYSWSDNDVSLAERDFYCATQGEGLTTYIDLIKDCECVINISGDMWGHNAEHVGHKRFYVDCLKMRTAQLLGIKTVLYAVTPGPFDDDEYDFAKEVFSNFNLVVVREKISLDNLKKWNFPLSNVIWAPCPSFLYEANYHYASKWTELLQEKGNVIGFTFGGFNMPVGPYDMWPRTNSQYDNFVMLAEYIINELGGVICLFSHTNGFNLPPDFKLINGRDFVILEQFYKILLSKDKKYAEKIILIDEPLLPCDIKTVISKFSMLITGRVHASVAATSQSIPTVFVEYDRRVIYSDKMLGFSRQISMEDYVCTPDNLAQMKNCVKECYQNRDLIHSNLKERIQRIKEYAEDGVRRIASL